jgi:hypothetical protein
MLFTGEKVQKSRCHHDVRSVARQRQGIGRGLHKAYAFAPDTPALVTGGVEHLRGEIDSHNCSEQLGHLKCEMTRAARYIN